MMIKFLTALLCCIAAMSAVSPIGRNARTRAFCTKCGRELPRKDMRKSAVERKKLVCPTCAATESQQQQQLKQNSGKQNSG